MSQRRRKMWPQGDLPAALPKPDWLPDWSGQAVVLCGSGPSASHIDWSRVRGRFSVVVVNNAFTLAPFADLLYSHAKGWWRTHPEAMRFRGIKVSVDPWMGCKTIKVRMDPNATETDPLGDRYLNEMVFDVADEIGWGKNGGFQALNLIAKARPSKIVMIGIDATIDFGVHFHGRHRGIKNPSASDVNVWRAHLDAAAPVFDRLGITVVNASGISTLTAYPKVDLYRELGC